MPHRRQPTRNRMGWTSNQPNELSRLFIDFCGSAQAPVLDLGAAYGVATVPALEAGARVIANDLDSDHLFEIPDHPNLTRLAGRFPDFDLPPGSLAAVHASNPGKTPHASSP